MAGLACEGDVRRNVARLGPTKAAHIPARIKLHGYLVS